MSETRTAFVTFFPIRPNNMGSSTVVNSRFINWPGKKRLFQISHIKKINNTKIQTIFIRKETPLYKIFSLPKMTFKVLKYLKKAKKKHLILEGASWIFYSFFIIFFLKIFIPKINIIYISHGIESEIRKKYSNFLIVLLTKILEKLVFKFSNVATSVSQKDKKKIKKIYSENTILLPNAISLEKITKKRKLKDDYIIYSGSYYYKPNRDAINLLNEYIMPSLIKKIPHIKLVLTGGGFKESFPWLKNKGIVSKKDLYNLIFYSKCMCVPLTFGYGTRIKIIEALSLGTVVISTKKGIEGIKLKNNNPPFVISNIKLFPSKIIEIIKNYNRYKKKSINEKNFYLKEYSMQNILKKFVNENKIK